MKMTRTSAGIRKRDQSEQAGRKRRRGFQSYIAWSSDTAGVLGDQQRVLVLSHEREGKAKIHM